MSDSTKTLFLFLLAAILAALILKPWKEHSVNIEADLKTETKTDIKKLHPKLMAIFLADQIDDPVERCLNYPPLDIKYWADELTQWGCNYLAQKFFDSAHMAQQLEARQYGEIEQEISSMVDDYIEGNKTEAEFFSVFDLFDDYSQNVESLTKEWINHSPGNPYAITAMGLMLSEKAWLIQAGRPLRQLEDNEREEFYQFLSEGNQYLEKAFQLNPQMLPAYERRISNSSIGSMEITKKFLDEALRTHPRSYFVRSTYLHLLKPRWGGSYVDMKKFINETLLEFPNEPFIQFLQNRIPLDKALTHLGNEEMKAGHELLIQALRYGPSTRALSLMSNIPKESGDLVGEFELLSQASRFQFKGDTEETSRAKLLVQFSEFEWAESIYKEIIHKSPTYYHVYTAYGYLLRKDTRDREAVEQFKIAVKLMPREIYSHQQIAWLATYRLRDHEMAKPHIDAMLEIDPESYLAWLYLADYWHDTGGEPLLTAIYNFLKYVDRDDPDMQQSIASIENYLRTHRGTTPN